MINQLGMHAFHENTYYAALRRCMAGDYREQIAKACFTHVWTDAGGDISLLLYDVTVRHEGVCQLNGVTGLCCQAVLGLLRRPSNRMSNALRACFHRWVQRALPRPVGSSAMTAR